MAVTHQYSTQYDAAVVDSPRTRQNVSTWGGNLQLAYFVHDQDGAGEATSDVAIIKLPAGRVRVILGLSRAYINWTTGSATLDLGWDAYTGLDGVAVTADPNGLIDGLDVDAVGMFGFDTYAAIPAGVRATGGTYLFESTTGVTLRLTSQDQALASGDDAAGYIAYIVH